MCDKIFKKNHQTKQKQYFMIVLKPKPCISTPIRYTQNIIQNSMYFEIYQILRWDKIVIKKNVLYDRGNK